ncbi:TonB-dependent receptor [Edaphobacter sp. 12200R-103]|uniref:TonB-dependent receptor n=1 Tax=Edaphobacter sp. 12200R-103 TaxID=2703788 RepID=UPI00138B71C0|nr:TonB-dependent receptor [Edaphobacter sp. 12200R-103]QHS52442.1 TonB-dependent receptor [Edaphobacter sp. 12200R-103]
MLRLKGGIVFFLVIFLFTTFLPAQTITGSVNGTVTDPGGAVVPGAKITITNVATNVSTSTETNSAGVYNIRFLQVGRYTLTMEAQGFAKQMSKPFTLEAGQNAKLDGQLAMQGAVSTVNVNSELVPLINTENAQLATTLDKTAIDAVPLIGRNFVQLTMFVPGAVSTTPANFAGNSAIGVGGQQVSVNGNREQSNNYLLDGIEINETLNNGVGYNPSPDALDQVQVISANAQAEYGNVNGGAVIALTKSGTNSWHGSAFYFLSSGLLDANTWANKHNSVITPRQPYTQPIFGGTLGGPILKDRLFFFVDYEGGRYHQGGIGTATVATEKMRRGDFSELLDPNIMCAPGASCTSKNLVQLYDSTSLPYKPYAGNLNVPILNPVARYLYAHPELYPLPNQAPQVGTPATNNYRAPTKNARQNNQGDIKVDWKMTQRDNLSVRYSQSENVIVNTPVLAISFPVSPKTPVKSVAINEVHTFNSSLVNELRIGYSRVHMLGGLTTDSTGAFGMNGNSIVGIGAAQVLNGFSGQVFLPPGTTGLTTPNGSEYTTFGNPGTATNYADNTFTYADNLTYLHGHHSFKFGAQFIRYQQNSLYPGNDGLLGQFVYTGNFTSNPTSGLTNNTQGYSVADFNLDRVAYVGTGNASGPLGPTGQRQWRDAYFAQDDWKITPTFTANIGIRYEFDQPMYEVNNKQANINMATGTLVYAGVNGVSRATVNPYYGSFMPRIGFAYSVTPRMVVRAGYGIQNYMEGTGANRRLTINPPFQTPYFAVGSAPSTSSSGQYFRVEDGFSNPATPSQSLSLNAWAMNIRPAFISEYSLTTEYQVSNATSVTIGYVGEAGQHLVNHGSANQLRQPCVINGIVQSNPNSAACSVANPAPYKALVGQSGSIVITTSDAMMNYNALQATVRQRSWHGLAGTINYTYARAMTNAVGFYGSTGIANANNYNQDYYNNHAEYGPTSQDVRHNLNGVMSYELPLCRGRIFGSNMNRALDEIVGGWKIGFTAVAYSGFPVTINNSVNNAYTNNKIQRANYYRPLKINKQSLNAWFGTDPSATSCATRGIDNGICAYGAPADGAYGTGRVGSARAPGYQQYDATASKDFTVWHEQKFSFRADASNVFNMTSLSNPNNTAQSANFGRITAVRSGPRRLQLSLRYTF